MKPNPLSSLNHFTVPVGICGYSSTVCACCCAEGAAQSLTCERLHCFSPVLSRPDSNETSRSVRTSVVEMFRGGPHRSNANAVAQRRFEPPGGRRHYACTR